MTVLRDAEEAEWHLPLASSRGRVALGATVAASAMASLDATIVGVALPRIADDLDVGLSGLQWVSAGYLVTLASLVLLGGALGDFAGRRRVFVAGIIGFTAASLLCGLAPDATWLTVGRLAQGVGAAFVTPGSLSLIQVSFRREDRAAAVGLWSALGGIAGAVGPFLGGWVVQGPGWRWAFLLNVPVAALAIAASRALPESRADETGHGFDIGGSVAAVAALGLGTWALIGAGDPDRSDVVVIAAGIAAVAAGALFVTIQRRSPHPLVPPTLFGSRDFTTLNLATFVLYGAISLLFFLVVLELQLLAGWSALEAGTAMLPATLLMLAGSAASGRLAERIGPRPQMVIGPLLVAAGLLLLSAIDDDAVWLTDVLPGALAVGVGLTTFVAPLTAAVMGSVDDDHVGTASAVNNAVARTGGLAAIAAVPVISGLSGATAATEIANGFRSAMWIAAGLAGASAVIAAVGLRRSCRVRHNPRAFHCAIDGAPLQPDLRRVDDPG